MFEVKEHDLWGRIGEIQTPSGKIETPALFPVVGSSNNIVSPRDLSEIFKFDSVITSAYLLSKRHEDPSSIDIHKRLDFDGTVMMDSGAYQILMYGDIELSLEESLALQQKVNADIGVILDIPTSMTDSFESAKKKVDETLLRAEQALEFLDKDRIWTLPIQGGKRIELIRYFTEKAIASDFLPSYQMFAIGSIAPIMSSYAYTTVGKMILTSRQNLPLDRPLHLFGGGHPMIFAFSVALGCDTFDSAAYVLMAKDGRYMTRFGTKRIENLDYFPCDCPECSKTTPETIRELNKMDQMAFLARHNLWVSQGEIRTIKQA
ncbi:MAG: tRNA guanosine(15) transglycosylase TgtA, partial [Candidatus Heimdallarchaeota archaeon]|nr:tRNA guanosine(15) transglycosylase TgtA [Candidatus Heimdallarchaeota archaeon]MCK5049669.1 tRNA guanosine(15) transglycosylase TgtA [Candidatus Heimdallarchaeota archaeon]